MGKGNVSAGVGVPRPYRSFYASLHVNTKNQTKPDVFIAADIKVMLPKDFSPVGKRVEIWAKNPPMGYSGDPLCAMCNAYSFDSEIKPGIVYSAVTDVYPNGGNSRGYLEYQILSPISYKGPYEQQIVYPYQEKCAYYYIPFQQKAWQSGGFYEIAVLLRLDFYDK